MHRIPNKNGRPTIIKERPIFHHYEQLLAIMRILADNTDVSNSAEHWTFKLATKSLWFRYIH